MLLWMWLFNRNIVKNQNGLKSIRTNNSQVKLFKCAHLKMWKRIHHIIYEINIKLILTDINTHILLWSGITCHKELKHR